MSDLVPVPIQSRRFRRSQEKGAVWERRVARMIGMWWCLDRESFWRTRGSGGLSRRTGIHHGDIAPVKFQPHQAPLTIECKHVKDWSLEYLLAGRSRCAALGFWRQLQRERRPGSFGMLMLRGNRTPIYVMLSSADLARIATSGGPVEIPRVVVPDPGVELWLFSDFVKVIPSEAVSKHFGRAHSDWRD